jgi:Flp pilus assembly protein TadD
VDSSTVELAHRAEDAFAAAEFKESYRLAVEGLEELGDHPGLLAIAGRAALELGLDEATTYLGRLVEQTPADATAWRDLGMARLSSADLTGAEHAVRMAVRIDPAEPSARASLGHLAYLRGAVDEADRQLSEAARLAPWDTGPLRSLIEMRRIEGRTQAAIAAAEELLRRVPEDLPATMSLAELNLLGGDYDAAQASYRRLTELDTATGHASHIMHGMIEVEIRRERWRQALDYAIVATTLDRHRLTTDVLAFVASRLFGDGEHPAPPHSEIEARLRARRDDHRRQHAEIFSWGG